MPNVELGHHANTHHAGYSERIHALEAIDTAVLTNLRTFLRKLQEGGLYDDTIVLFHCGMGDAATHGAERTLLSYLAEALPTKNQLNV